MPETEVWTIGKLLAWTQKFLATRGADSPRLDAEVLLAHALGCRRIELYTQFDQAPTDAQRTTFRELVRRRGEGTPVAYLVGKREFYSLDFEVSPDVLIPRPETELVVVAVLDVLKAIGAERQLDVADIGTGTGAIAVAVAKHAPRVRVLATDISPAALAVARRNVARHELPARIDLCESDLFSGIEAARTFDVVASNPPYVASGEMESLAPDVREHEPRLALEAGARGTEIIERLAEEAAERVRPGGKLIVEISPQIERAVHALLESKGWQLAPTVRDLAGLPRVIVATRSS